MIKTNIIIKLDNIDNLNKIDRICRYLITDLEVDRTKYHVLNDELSEYSIIKYSDNLFEEAISSKKNVIVEINSLEDIKGLKNVPVDAVIIPDELAVQNLKRMNYVKDELNLEIFNIDSHDLFIFDFDGTLVDSMGLWKHASSNFVKYCNLTPADDLDRDILKLNSIQTATLLHNTYGIGSNPNECMRMFNAYFVSEYVKQPIKEGAIEFLEYVKSKGKRMILLSATDLDLLTRSCEAHDLTKYFSAIYSTSNMGTTKSDGSAYTKILNLYLPRRPIIFEDAVHALTGCVAARCDVVGIRDSQNIKLTDKVRELSTYYSDLNKLIK